MNGESAPLSDVSIGLRRTTISMNTNRLVFLFATTLILMVFYNDITNYGNLQLGINLRVDRIALTILLITFLRGYFSQETRVPLNKVELCMLWLFLYTLASCILFGGINAANNRHISSLVNFTGISAILFAIARRLTFDKQSLFLLMRFFQILGLYLGVTGILEHFHVDSLIFPKYILDPHIGLHVGRSRGPFGNAAVMGGVLSILFLWTLWQQMRVKRSWLNIAVLFTTSASVYYTDTRSAWLIFAASVAVLSLFSKPVRKACILIGVLLLAVYFSGVFSKFSFYQPTLFSRREATVEDRENIMRISWEMFLDSPLLGVGYGNYERANDPYFDRAKEPMRGDGEGQHNTVLGLLVELGIMGTIPYLYIYYSFVKVAFSESRAVREANGMEREIASTQLALLAGLILYMQFGDIRFFNIVNYIMYWMAGVVFSAARQAHAQGSVEAFRSTFGYIAAEREST